MNRSYSIQKIIYYIIGIVLLSLGVTLTLISELGAGGWDALVENLYRITSVSMGMWVFILAIVLVLLASVIKRKLPDLFALAVAFLTGRFIDFWYSLLFDSLDINGFIGRLSILLLGLLLIAFGSAMIFVTNLPRNHTETFVFSIVDTFHIQYKIVKTIADTSALGIALFSGFILSDFTNLGLGTIISTFFMGVLTQFFMPFADKGLNYLTKKKGLSYSFKNASKKY